MKVADRNGERVGRVEWRGRLGEAEQQLNHRLHLPFFGAAVSDHRLLHFGGRVFDDRHARFNGREHGDAARVAKPQRASRVGRVKQVFDGDDVGPVPSEQGAQLDVNDSEFFRKSVGSGDRNGAAGDHPVAGAIALHASVAGAR